MQETMQDGSHGKTFVKDTIEALVPHIKKSLEDPNVKFVKIFMARGPIKNEEIFSAEEQKSSPIDELIEKFEEGDKKNKEEKGTKVPEMKIDPGKPFVFGEERLKKKASSLDYPITVLESERDNACGVPPRKADQLQRAIDILNNEKYRAVKEEFKEKHGYFDRHALKNKKEK